MSAPPRPTPPADASPGAIIRWTIDVLNAHDAEPLRQVFAPDIRARYPTRTAHGRDEVVGFFSGLFAAVPDVAFTIQGMAAQEGDVFLRWRITGTHSGADWEGIAATGARVDLDGIDHFVVEDGRIASNFVVFDQMQFARQIGLLPADGSRVDVVLKRGFNALARRRAGR
ncbi:ester cyclase [Actinomycetospora aeridis]|uniref:Ester cyclase n=1 Tax=Actinomycetospora aeridis TaxID=3129231 RepID=A0ABU8N2Y7_9PSEU